MNIDHNAEIASALDTGDSHCLNVRDSAMHCVGRPTPNDVVDDVAGWLGTGVPALKGVGWI